MRGWSASAIDTALREIPTASATSRSVTVDRDGGKGVDGMRWPDLVDGADGHLTVPVSEYGSDPRQRLRIDRPAPALGDPTARPRTLAWLRLPTMAPPHTSTRPRLRESAESFEQ